MEIEHAGYAYLLLAGGTLVALFVALVGVAWAARHNWVGGAGKQQVCGGAFRSAPVTTGPRPQARRFLVLGTALLSVGWAILTFFFFMPAGALAGLVGLMGLGTGGPDGLIWIGLGVAALSALPLTAVMIANAMMNVQRAATGEKLGVGTAVFVGLHHVYLVVLGLGNYVGASDGGIGAFTAIAASPGILLAMMIAASALLSRRDV